LALEHLPLINRRLGFDFALEKIIETLSDPSYVAKFSKLANWTGESGEKIAKYVVATLKSWKPL